MATRLKTGTPSGIDFFAEHGVHASPEELLANSSWLGVPRVGRDKRCGRMAPGVLKEGSHTLCSHPCPRCGKSPFYLISVGPYTGNVGIMSVEDAVAFIQTVDVPEELEVIARLEVFANPPRGRREVLVCMFDQYWEVAMYEDPMERGEILTLDECIDRWINDLKNPATRNMYIGLILAV